MEINILGINGSPHRKSRTVQLINTVLESAREEGAGYSIIHLIDYPISHCMGCYSKKPELCNPEQFKEMLPELFQRLLENDCYVFGTPVYWFGPSGIIKNFIDLLTAMDNKGKYLKNKLVACVVSMEEDGAVSAASQILIPLNFMGSIIPPYAITYLSEGEDEAETMDEALRIGKNLVKFAKLLK